MSTDPRADEAQSPETATFTFRGVDFVIPRDRDDWPLTFSVALEEGASMGLLAKHLLGAEQWATVGRLNLRRRDAMELLEEISKAMGLTAGESSASPR